MKYIDKSTFTGERALFMSRDVTFHHCVFEDGESPLKESSNLDLFMCEFRWKYPLWYCKDIKCNNIKFLETARSGIWYTENIEIVSSNIEAPKTFRRSNKIRLINVKLPNASETLWKCNDVYLDHVSCRGDYFGFNSENVDATDILIDGNYCFDGGKNITVRNSTINSKDSFWNCENVTLINCKINGEYLAWNTKNLTMINCTIISHQGLCYIDGLKMINCKLIDSDLCLEFCKNIDVDLINEVNSIKNPISGTIRALGIKELILDRNLVDKSKLNIIVNNEKI